MEPTQTIRKACDFCYKRKIKCDGVKPCCSTCVTHERQCTYGTPSREYKPKGSKRTATNEDSSNELQSRIQQLEAVVGQLTERLHDNAGWDESETQPRVFDQLFTQFFPKPLGGSMANMRRRSVPFNLPPRQLTLPLVYSFIENFNSVLPLFHSQSLLLLVRETYLMSNPLLRFLDSYYIGLDV